MFDRDEIDRTEASRERVANPDVLELPEVAVVRPKCADTVLSHQRDEVRIGDQVPSYDDARGRGHVDAPEALGLSHDPRVGEPDELLDVVDGVLR
jgi:hypothetical protein